MMIKNKKVLVLCSGGFDSIVMTYKLAGEIEDLVLLFFNYGQSNYQQEKQAVEKVKNTFDIEMIEIELPKMTWTNSTLISGEVKESEDQYLEMRNLIFLSYACSVAESKNIKDIYMAMIESENSIFKDATLEFISYSKKLLENLGISFFTPFCHYDKGCLLYLAREFELNKSDFFSCNTPIKGEPCGKCGDCLTIDDIYSIKA